MSVRTAIYQKLAQDPEINAMVARSTVEGMEDQPAIYERWAAPDTPFPYINLTYEFGEGSAHWVKREGILNVDIFTGSDSTEAEAIAGRVTALLDHKQSFSPEDGQIESYFLDERDVPEDTPDITHWNMTFRLDHWRESFIQTLE